MRVPSSSTIRARIGEIAPDGRLLDVFLEDARDPGSQTIYTAEEALVLRAVGETGISGRTRTAVLERPVFEALDAAVHGADLVMVGAGRKRLLRPALPRRVARGA